MAEQQYQESNYRFSDPIRFFKANDPYYFEVDNIPLKQLQENCLWLKDQVRKDTNKLLGVKRSDIDELRPYSSGADRLVRVKPGRYTARINDASTREPLAYLRKVMGNAVGDVDAWAAALPNPGDFKNNKNAILEETLDRFKSILAQDALGMNGLVERAFTWPVIDVNRPIDLDGTELNTNNSWLSYGGLDVNIPGGKAAKSPFVITEAIAWARSEGASLSEVALPSYEITNPNNGFAKFPLTESYFIKAWRGVSRLSIVDVDDELSIEVPQFDPDDFSYTDEDGETVSVAGVTQRVDLVFIYSKPIDASAVNTIQNGAVTKISKPALGIVKGAGIRANYQEKTSDIAAGFKTPTEDSIQAAPGDQSNDQMGFTSTSANDIAVSVRGSFPSPDDLMNIAPLISQNLEDNAYELIGQSILPVAYVFVQDGSQVVLTTDVIDIRPLFRTAELTYNERAGIGAAFPQLSLANPAVGKAQLDTELRSLNNNIQGGLKKLTETLGAQNAASVVATGYVFGGYNFGPEGAMFDFYQTQFAGDSDDDNDSIEAIRQFIKGKYGFGSEGTNITIPDYPDWDLSQWCSLNEDLDSKGLFPNDYINTFISRNQSVDPDPSLVAGSFKDGVTPEGNKVGTISETPARLVNFRNARMGSSRFGRSTRASFHYISKKIKFDRPSWVADYLVEPSLVNCLAQNYQGSFSNNGTYFGCWVEKGFDEFTIYVAFNATGPTDHTTPGAAMVPAPHTMTEVSNYSTKKKKKTKSRNVSITQRDGERFSGFVVPVSDILYSNTDPIGGNGTYLGNPRLGKCTYPTVMWRMTAIPEKDSSFLYGNLNNTEPTISIKN